MQKITSLYNQNAEPARQAALVYTEASSQQPNHWLIIVATGAKRSQLQDFESFGPFTGAELEQMYDKLLESLLSQGFQVRSANQSLIDDLNSESSHIRARAALRLGWRGAKQAAPQILARIPDAVDDLCSLADALGHLGATEARPELLKLASRKLLSRRRSGLEALRRIDSQNPDKTLDQTQWNDIHSAIIDRLPGELPGVTRQLSESNDQPSPEAMQAIFKAIEACGYKYYGLICDTYYELGSPLANSVAKQLLEGWLNFNDAFHWRYVKSVFKRARLRRDWPMFAWLGVLIERRGRQSKGSFANVKSGYDGQKRHTPIFRNKTVNYCRRLCWREMRELARSEPGQFAQLASEFLVQYLPGDEVTASGLRGSLTYCYMLNKILFGESNRLKLDPKTLTHTFKNWQSHKMPATPSAARQELSFSEIWDSQPSAAVKVLAHSKLHWLPEYFFAQIKPIEDLVFAAAAIHDLLTMIQNAPSKVRTRARRELEARIDPNNPDWNVILDICHSTDPDNTNSDSEAEAFAQAWLEKTKAYWFNRINCIRQLLQLKNARLRTFVLNQISATDLPKASKTALCADILSMLSLSKTETGEIKVEFKKEAFEGQYETLAQISLAVLPELNDQLSFEQLHALLNSNNQAFQSIAGQLLPQRPDTLKVLGLNGVVAIAEHPIGAVRQGAMQLLDQLLAELQKQPGPLFALVESDWPDVRSYILNVLREHISFAVLGYEGIFALIDSTRADVQQLGQNMLLQHMDQFSPTDILRRLSEHPDPAFHPLTLLVLEVLNRQTQAGEASPLKAAIPLLRSVFIMPRPSRQVKTKALELLQSRIADREIAQSIAEAFADLLWTHTNYDHEAILTLFAEIQLHHPDLSMNGFQVQSLPVSASTSEQVN